MDKIGIIFWCLFDLVVSSIVIPIVYVLEVSYLIYGTIRYKVDFIDNFMNINKKYIDMVMRGFKIHKERIFGV